MKIRNFEQLLREAGCYFVKHGGSHDKWYSPITGRHDWIPRHPSQELGSGLEKKYRRTLLGEE